MDCVSVENDALSAKVGVLEWERHKPQDIVVTVHAFLDLTEVSEKADKTKMLDYRDIQSAIRETADARHYLLLEEFCEHVAKRVKSLGAQKVTVKACKPQALKNALACVTLER